MALAELSDGHVAADSSVQLQRDAEVEDALDFPVQDMGREPVVGDAVAQHAACHFMLIVDRHRVSAARHLIGEREAGGAGADHPDALLLRIALELFQRQLRGDRPVPQEALERVDRHGTVLLGAVAAALAGMRANAPQH